MSAHTIGQLTVGTDDIIDIKLGTPFHCLRHGDTVVAITGGVKSLDSATAEVDARRLVACWNACIEIKTEDLEANIVGELIADEIASRTRAHAETDQLRTELAAARALLARDIKAEISQEEGMVAEAAWALIRVAEDYGYILTISQQARWPLAMGNYRSVVEVRPARVMATKEGA